MDIFVSNFDYENFGQDQHDENVNDEDDEDIADGEAEKPPSPKSLGDLDSNMKQTETKLK